MSTLKATNLQHKDSSNPNVVLYADGTTSIRSLQNFASNLVINGAMTVSQRTTSTTSVTAGAYRACDRFQFAVGALGTWTVEQDDDAPAGFGYSMRMTCTTADASPAAGDTAFLLQSIEAQNLQGLAVGTNSAKPLNLSFWVKSNKTGNASVGLLQGDASNRMFSATYEIKAADTWEHKTIAITADTGGTINNDNGDGLRIDWWLNGGSDYTGGSAQSWGALVAANRNPSNLGVGGAANDYFAITGVQLTATNGAIEFQHEDISTTLAKCQRYCYVINNANADAYLPITGFAKTNGQGVFTIHYPVRMRKTNPTFTLGQIATNFKIFHRATQTSATAISQSDVTDMGGNYNVSCSAGSLDVGDSLVLGTGANAGGDGFIIDAEL